MRYPEFLKDGDTIGFPAPSFGCAGGPYALRFDNALRRWRREGYRVVEYPNARRADGIGISSTPESCGRELTEAWCDPETDVLISCGGGELMCETLDYVDFDRIRAARPKWYMGYSDNTNFTFLLATLCDTASVYGPCAAAFGMRTLHPSLKDAMALLRGEKRTLQGYKMYEVESLRDEENPLAPYHLTRYRRIRAFDGERLLPLKSAEEPVPVAMEGRLMGGCLDVLANLAGTKYDRTADFVSRYQDDGIIWFLEACDLNVFGIRRAVWELDRAGWFRTAKGFLFGRPLAARGQEMMGLDPYGAEMDLLKKYHVPILMDLDIGHLPPMMPLICGSYARVRCAGQEFEIAMETR